MNQQNILLAALLLTLPTFATAQQKLALEEVLVTAQKKEESLQDTPVALSAFGEDALEREGINNIGDLANNVPALTIAPFPINSTTLRLYIRGIGLIDVQITQDPPIGVYIDGAYIARSSALATDIADLQRIEVLRGPQGTLYGRNSTGGALNLITKRPNPDATEFKQAFTFGDRNLLTSKTSINLPLWSGAAAKLAYYHKEIDGAVENTGVGDDFGNNDTDGYRIDLGWDITDKLRLDYGWDRADVEQTTLTYTHILPTPPLPGSGAGPALTNQINEGAASLIIFNPEGKRRDKIHSAVDIYPSINEIEGHVLTLDWGVSDALQMKYTLAHRDLYDATPTNNLASDTVSDGYRLDTLAIFGFPLNPVPGGTAPCATICTGRSVQYPNDEAPMTQSQLSHELQFSGSYFEDRLSFITGLYYFTEAADIGPPVLRHLLSGPLGDDPSGGRIEVMAGAAYEIDNSAKALYSQFTWRPPILDDRFSVTLGARHSEDERDARALRRQFTFLVTPGDGNNKTRSNFDTAVQLPEVFYDVTTGNKFGDDSFSLILEWDVFDDFNLYAKSSEAYKSGGYNIREQITAAGAQRFKDGFDEEKVSALELGMKARFFDNRLQINSAIFKQEIEGQQLNFTVPGSTSDTTVANAGASTLDGFEMDTTLLAAEGLIFILNYAYLEGEIEPSLNPLSGEIEDNFVFDSAPRHSYTAAVDWTLHYSDRWGRLAFNATYSFTDERNGGATKEFSTFRADKQDDFAVINARLGIYEMPAFNGLLNVALWSKNITDEAYSLNNVHNLPGSGRSIIFAEPRTYGLDLIYHWTN